MKNDQIKPKSKRSIRRRKGLTISCIVLAIILFLGAAAALIAGR